MVCEKKNTKTIRPRTFVEMRASLSPAESDVLDIIFFLMGKKEYDEKTLTFTIDAHEFEGLFVNNRGKIMSAKRIYERIRNGTDGLYELDLQFTEDTEVVKRGICFRAIGAKAWNAGNGKIRIQLTPIMCEVMKEQQKKAGYALYDIRFQFALKSGYAKRLYPMLAKFRNTGERYDNARELREKLGVPEGYTQSKFMAILRGAVDEINEKTNMRADMISEAHSISGGKSIDAVTWKIRECSTAEARPAWQETCITKTMELFDGKVDRMDAERIAACADFDIGKVKKAEEILESYQKPVADTTAFLLSAINGEWKKGKETQKKRKTADFEQREYNYEQLELMLLTGSTDD